jgi:hypothetical protein
VSWRLLFHRRRVKPLLFTVFNILITFTAGSIILLLLKPKTPVTRVKPRKKKILHREGGRG